MTFVTETRAIIPAHKDILYENNLLPRLTLIFRNFQIFTFHITVKMIFTLRDLINPAPSAHNSVSSDAYTYAHLDEISYVITS